MELQYIIISGTVCAGVAAGIGFYAHRKYSWNEWNTAKEDVHIVGMLHSNRTLGNGDHVAKIRFLEEEKRFSTELLFLHTRYDTATVYTLERFLPSEQQVLPRFIHIYDSGLHQVAYDSRQFEDKSPPSNRI
jgi:hypothetical protein